MKHPSGLEDPTGVLARHTMGLVERFTFTLKTLLKIGLKRLFL
ncbi:MAG: hypothetical protein AAF564_13045 [Bacteroidota bacterium]